MTRVEKVGYRETENHGSAQGPRARESTGESLATGDMQLFQDPRALH